MSDPRCTCSHGTVSGGSVDGIRMPPIRARLDTTLGCPVHDTCQGYTREHRALASNGRWLYCPIHGTKNCPPSSLLP